MIFPPVTVIVVDPRQAAALLLHLCVTVDQPLLVFAPDGTQLQLWRDQQPACALEAYDSTSPADLRRRLQDHGLSL